MTRRGGYGRLPPHKQKYDNLLRFIGLSFLASLFILSTIATQVYADFVGINTSLAEGQEVVYDIGGRSFHFIYEKSFVQSSGKEIESCRNRLSELYDYFDSSSNSDVLKILSGNSLGSFSFTVRGSDNSGSVLSLLGKYTDTSKFDASTSDVQNMIASAISSILTRCHTNIRHSANSNEYDTLVEYLLNGYSIYLTKQSSSKLTDSEMVRSYQIIKSSLFSRVSSILDEYGKLRKNLEDSRRSIMTIMATESRQDAQNTLDAIVGSGSAVLNSRHPISEISNMRANFLSVDFISSELPLGYSIAGFGNVSAAKLAQSGIFESPDGYVLNYYLRSYLGNELSALRSDILSEADADMSRLGSIVSDALRNQSSYLTNTQISQSGSSTLINIKNDFDYQNTVSLKSTGSSIPTETQEEVFSLFFGSGTTGDITDTGALSFISAVKEKISQNGSSSSAIGFRSEMGVAFAKSIQIFHDVYSAISVSSNSSLFFDIFGGSGDSAALSIRDQIMNRLHRKFIGDTSGRLVAVDRLAEENVSVTTANAFDIFSKEFGDFTESLINSIYITRSTNLPISAKLLSASQYSNSKNNQNFSFSEPVDKQASYVPVLRNSAIRGFDNVEFLYEPVPNLIENGYSLGDENSTYFLTSTGAGYRIPLNQSYSYEVTIQPYGSSVSDVRTSLVAVGNPNDEIDLLTSGSSEYSSKGGIKINVETRKKTNSASSALFVNGLLGK